jgi:hypothetical protein
MAKKRKGTDPDGRIAIAIRRADCVALLKYVAEGARPALATVRRMETPLLTKAERRAAKRLDPASTTLVFVSEAFAEIKAALHDHAKSKALLPVVKDAAEQFRIQDRNSYDDPLPAGDISVRPADPRKLPRPGREPRIISGGLPGSRRSH